MRDSLELLEKSLIFTVLILVPAFVLATDLESSNFRIRDPIIPPAGGYSTSDSFRLTGMISQIGIGTSSASNFRVSSGFLYFPAVVAPTLAASVGDGEVSLSWIGSYGVLGWNVSGYSAGRSTTSGGPYAFTSMGSTTSGTISGLSNGTVYYFVVRSEDFFGNPLATSSEVSATPVASATPSPAPSTPPSSGPIGPIFELINYFIKITPPKLPEGCVPEIPQDLNCDGEVNLRDLSVFLFFSPEPTPNPADFNNDKVVDLQDLSFLFFNWTERLLTFIPENGSREVAERPFEEVEQDKSGFAFVGEAVGEKEAKKQPISSEATTTIRLILDFFGRVFLRIWSLMLSFL